MEHDASGELVVGMEALLLAGLAKVQGIQGSGAGDAVQDRRRR
jgi:hypothetical protein